MRAPFREDEQNSSFMGPGRNEESRSVNQFFMKDYGVFLGTDTTRYRSYTSP